MRPARVVALAVAIVAIVWAAYETRAPFHTLCADGRGWGSMTRDGWDGEYECFRYERVPGPHLPKIAILGVVALGALVVAIRPSTQARPDTPS